MLDTSFFNGKTILITGHTGFKGSWMSKLLVDAGAKVIGYALNPPTNPNLFQLCNLENKMVSIHGDIRDLEHLKKAFDTWQPEIVIHMAAQPLVRESYVNPVYTYDVNVMGTVNVLECIRTSKTVRSFVNVTTDKVYLNREWEWGYRENEELNGYDPYSNSKSCSELVTSCYKKSFFVDKNVAISTVRAGNVVGGGDFAKDRIIPDCLRSAMQDKNIVVRNPHSIRPYEHVLEPVVAYLILAKAQYQNVDLAGNYNIGPNEEDCLTTGELADLFCEKWNRATGGSITWINQFDGGPYEANFLKLDCSKFKQTFSWSPRWNMRSTMDKIVEWGIAYSRNPHDCEQVMEKQIRDFLSE